MGSWRAREIQTGLVPLVPWQSRGPRLRHRGHPRASGYERVRRRAAPKNRMETGSRVGMEEERRDRVPIFGESEHAARDLTKEDTDEAISRE